jgi:hypothetical protein
MPYSFLFHYHNSVLRVVVGSPDNHFLGHDLFDFHGIAAIGPGETFSHDISFRYDACQVTVFIDDRKGPAVIFG